MRMVLNLAPPHPFVFAAVNILIFICISPTSLITDNKFSKQFRDPAR